MMGMDSILCNHLPAGADSTSLTGKRMPEQYGLRDVSILSGEANHLCVCVWLHAQVATPLPVVVRPSTL